MHRFALPPERYPFYHRLIFAVFVLALPVLIASQPILFRDGDVSWHIAAGRWILEHRELPRTDPFSFTMAGQPWLAIEWGAEIVYAAAYDVAGYAGLAAVATLALTALAAVLFWHLRTRIGPVGLLVSLTAFHLVFVPFVMARPHLLAMPLLALWTAVLLKARDRDGEPPFLLLPLMLVWANLHGSFVFGFVIAAAIALDVLVANGWDRRKLLRWLAFGIGSVVAALLNAYGLAGFVHPLAISSMKVLPFIGEWKASSPAVTPLFYLVLLGGLGGLLTRRHAPFTLGELLLLLLSLAMAFWHVRHQAVFIILAVLVVGPRLGLGHLPHPASAKSPGARRLAVAAGLAAALLVVAARAAVPLDWPESKSRPRTLVASIPPALRSRPVFNEYGFGGPLILAGIRPLIDGRADMYGDDFVERYAKITNGEFEEFDSLVAQYRIAWTIMPPQSLLAKELDRRSDWKRVYADSIGAIHVRTAGQPGAAPAAASGKGRALRPLSRSSVHSARIAASGIVFGPA